VLLTEKCEIVGSFVRAPDAVIAGRFVGVRTFR
jgi:hypothetical protein